MFGTGKTTTLSHWAARGAARYGHDKVIVCSLTRTAAYHAARTIELPYQQFGTVHAFAYRALGSPGLAETDKALKEWNKEYPDFELSGHGQGKTPDDGHLMPEESTSGDALKLEYTRLRTLGVLRSDPVWQRGSLRGFMERWDDFKTQNHWLDFCDLIEVAEREIDAAPGEPAVILLDEGQDTAQAEVRLLMKWAKRAQHFVVAGDFAQCHPPGTLIATSRGDVMIENLDSLQHRVLSYDRHDKQIYGYRRPVYDGIPGYRFEKCVQNYAGDMFHIRMSNGKEVQCTPEHRWPIKWRDAVQDLHVTYLMRRGTWWRIGWCKLFLKGWGGFHIGRRSLLEKADETWILTVHRTKQEASLMESVIAAKYGLPLITFRGFDPGYAKRTVYTDAGIAWIFGQLDASEQLDRALRCLLDHGKVLHCPIWAAKEHAAKYGKRVSPVVHACNLIPEAHLLADVVRGRGVDWREFAIQRSSYDGVIYGLNVEPYHTYIANGVVTHNSLFSFRGSDPLLLQRLWDEHDATRKPLEQSYRLPQAVYDYAWTWQERFRQTCKVPYLARKDGVGKVVQGEVVSCAAFNTFTDHTVSMLLQPYLDVGKEVLFQATCGYMLDPIVRALRDAGIPFHNSLRPSNGKWNPLPQRRGRGFTIVDRVLAFSRPRGDLWGEQARYWSVADVKCWALALPSTNVFSRGGHARVEALGDDASDEDIAGAFATWFSPDVLGRIVPKPDIGWYLSQVKGSDNLRDYVEKVIARYGVKQLQERPLVSVGTIHSTKGGESAVVIVSPDLSLEAANAARMSEESREECVRIFYVAVTRSSEILCLADPSTRVAVRW